MIQTRSFLYLYKKNIDEHKFYGVNELFGNSLILITNLSLVTLIITHTF